MSPRLLLTVVVVAIALIVAFVVLGDVLGALKNEIDHAAEALA